MKSVNCVHNTRCKWHFYVWILEPLFFFFFFLMEWSNDGRKIPSRSHIPPHLLLFYPSVALNLSSFLPNSWKCGYIFYTHPFRIKTDTFILYCLALPSTSTPHPLKPSVTGYYHRFLIFSFVSNNMVAVNHVQLTTVTAITPLLTLPGISTVCEKLHCIGNISEKIDTIKCTSI